MREQTPEELINAAIWTMLRLTPRQFMDNYIAGLYSDREEDLLEVIFPSNRYSIEVIESSASYLAAAEARRNLEREVA